MNQPVPILFIDTSPTPTRGGAQKSLLFILSAIDKSKFTPYVIMFVPHDIENELDKLDIPYFIVEPGIKPKQNEINTSPPEPKNYHGSWRDLAYRFKSLITVEWKRFRFICTIQNNIQAKLIYLNGNYTAAHCAILAAKWFGLPLVAHQRRLSVYTLLDRYFARWIDCMIMYSAKYMDYLHQLGVLPKRETVIYNAVPVDELPILHDDQILQYKNELQLCEPIPILCHIGTIHPIKGQDLTLKAIQKIWDSEHPFYVLYIGEERNVKYVEALKKLIVNTTMEKYIRLLGARHDVLSLLNICSISLEATKAEAGFSRVVIESLCMGKIVVAPLAGCSEIIEEGNNGILYQDHDVDDCAKAILRALNIETETVSANAKNTAIKLFNEKSVIKKIEDTLLELLAIKA